MSQQEMQDMKRRSEKIQENMREERRGDEIAMLEYC